jgi:sugar lactone lactonase YvrE
MDVKLLVHNDTQLGEGPVWDHRNGILYWVDIEQGNVQAYDHQSGKNTVYPMGEYVGAAVPAEDGRLIVALQNRVELFDPSTGESEILCEPEDGRKNNRFNDGKCDPAGRFWVGSTQIDHRDPTGVLYCIESSAYEPKLRDLTISNGMAWSPDHTTMYFIDSPTHRVQEFDYDLDKAAIRYRRDTLQFNPRYGVPDGMCIDSEGMLWIAFYGGGRVGRYDPTGGNLIHEIKLPVKNTTSCCFGGPDMNVLFITSARRDDPLGGGLYGCRPGVSGPLADFFHN